MPFDIEYVTRTCEVERYFNVTCDGCWARLEPIGPVDHDGGWERLHAEEALELRLMS